MRINTTTLKQESGIGVMCVVGLLKKANDTKKKNLDWNVIMNLNVRKVRINLWELLLAIDV